MKMIIAGGRDYYLQPYHYSKLDNLDITEIVSGCCSGADSCGEFYAERILGVPVRSFPALWNLHGKAAGPIRNKQMAEYADGVCLFPGGKGTESMHKLAVEAGIKIYDFRGY